MFKKGLAALFFSLILAMALGTTGFAADLESSPEVEKAFEHIEKTNEKIFKEIEKAEVKADRMYADYLSKAAKEKDEKKKEKLFADYEKKVTSLIDKLREKAEKMTEKGISKAAEDGVITEIYLVKGVFGDREAWIDPIRVIGW